MSKTTINEYGYYSKKLNQPFDTLDQLRAAEAADQKAKEEKLAAAKAKKDAAREVEDAYKTLNAAKRTYKSKLSNAVVKYTNGMKDLQKAYASEKAAITQELAAAEQAYSDKLKDFTNRHPEGFHITLRDGDYETTIVSDAVESADKNATNKPTYSDWISQLFSEFFQ